MLKIAFISQPEYFRFMYENELDSFFTTREFVFNFSMPEDSFKNLEDFSADINLFFRGEFFPEVVLKRLKGIKVSLSSEPFPNNVNGKLNYSLDSLKRFQEFTAIREKSFDYIFHYDRSSLAYLKRNGIALSGEFYFPVATSVYRKIASKKKWDFFFVGRSTEHREMFFGPLKHHYSFLHLCHGIWGPDLVEYINSSKILLNIHAEDEISWEPRVQMLMSTGNLVISERITSNPYLIPDSDYVEIDHPKELFEKAKYYLEHEEEREVIAQNGRKKILSLFDSRIVFTDFISNLCAGKFKRSSFTKTRSNLGLLKLNAYLKTFLRSINHLLIN